LLAQKFLQRPLGRPPAKVARRHSQTKHSTLADPFRSPRPIGERARLPFWGFDRVGLLRESALLATCATGTVTTANKRRKHSKITHAKHTSAFRGSGCTAGLTVQSVRKTIQALLARRKPVILSREQVVEAHVKGSGPGFCSPHIDSGYEHC